MTMNMILSALIGFTIGFVVGEARMCADMKGSYSVEWGKCE